MAPTPHIITVTLNPAVDRLVEAPALAPGEHLPARELARVPGGKGVNVSRVLSALGVGSIATGFLGSDNRDQFAAFLADPLVTDAFVSRPGRTRENVTIAARDTTAATHIRDAGEPVSPDDIASLENTLAGLCTSESTIVFSGSTPAQFDPSTYARLVRQCVESGARVAADTNGPALHAITGQSLWLLKPNEAELAEIAGGPLPSFEDELTAARRLLDDVEHVLLSRGQHGARLITRSQTLRAHVPDLRKPVVNTVGCGDTLLAAFVASRHRGEELPAALGRAVATATASARSPTTATFDPKLADAFAERVDVATID